MTLYSPGEDINYFIAVVIILFFFSCMGLYVGSNNYFLTLLIYVGCCFTRLARDYDLCWYFQSTGAQWRDYNLLERDGKVRTSVITSFSPFFSFLCYITIPVVLFMSLTKIHVHWNHKLKKQSNFNATPGSFCQVFKKKNWNLKL